MPSDMVGSMQEPKIPVTQEELLKLIAETGERNKPGAETVRHLGITRAITLLQWLSERGT